MAAEVPRETCDLRSRHLLAIPGDHASKLLATIPTKPEPCQEEAKKPSFWNYLEKKPEKQWTMSTAVLIENKSVCAGHVDMLIMVHSHPNNSLGRNITRKTWASPAYFGQWPGGGYTLRTRLVFVVGIAGKLGDQVVQREAREFGDILQGSFQEAYFNLTRKHVFALNWISRNCRDVTYVMKADDDVFVNLRRLQQILEISPLRRSVIGHLWQYVRLRNGHPKYGVSPREYPFKTWPYMMPGSSHVITRDALEDLVGAAEYVPYLHLDDAFITGILARIVGLNHIKLHQTYRKDPVGGINANTYAAAIRKNSWIDAYRSSPFKDRLKIWNLLQT